MNVYFNLSIINGNVLQIQDTTQEYNSYLPEKDNAKYYSPGRFKYSDTCTVNVIKYASTKNSEIVEVIITPHLENETLMFLDEATHTLQKDGHYIIEHLILPSNECIQYLINLDDSSLDAYNLIYSTDGNRFYKWGRYKEDEDCEEYLYIQEPCSIDEILEINPETITTISKSIQDTFSICLLNNQYLELNYKALQGYQKCQKLDNFNADLIWMTINAIKYNIEFGLLNQAQALLEEISYCKIINMQNNNGCKCCM